jgi:hypothetical protein
MITSNLYELLAVIISPPDPLQLLLRGLLGEGEASQLLLCPRRLTNSEKIV